MGRIKTISTDFLYDIVCNQFKHCPLNPQSQGKEQTVFNSPLPRKPLKAANIIFATSFVFPNNETDNGTIKYIINDTILFTIKLPSI